MNKLGIIGKIEAKRKEVQRLKKEIREINFYSLHRNSLQTQLGETIWNIVLLKEQLEKLG